MKKINEYKAGEIFTTSKILPLFGIRNGFSPGLFSCCIKPIISKNVRYHNI